MSRMTPLEYHEWCKKIFPVGSRVYVNGTEVTFSGNTGSFKYEYVGLVTDHPYEWSEGGDAESGPVMDQERGGLEIECEGVKRDEYPLAPGDESTSNPWDFPTTVQLVEQNTPLGWIKGREEMLRAEEKTAREAAAMAEYEANRDRCPKCGEHTLKHSSVCTLGYPGHPGAEFSAYEKCENCDYKDLA